ncbi:MAG: tRNA pseudouridine(38-40) synthase TruA [Flavobacteriales bacterium]
MENSRFFCEISYDGTRYSGWQIQPNASTIQGTIEEALSKLNGNQPISIVGCGRTDTGVHANQYFFHTELPIINLSELRYKLNKMLPNDIKIINAYYTQLHARFDAKKRTYRYFLAKEKSPFNDRFCWVYERSISVDAMNQACAYLIGQQDFASFAKGDTDVKTTLCEVFSASWEETNEGYVFEVSANRFLRNMVRAMVGTLLEVGLGNIPPSSIQDILAKKSRQEAALSVPASGLFLWKIQY